MTESSKLKNRMTVILIAIAGTALVLAGVSLTVALTAQPPSRPPTSTPVTSAEPEASERATEAAAPDSSPQAHDTERSLLFMIEEEKLAHDVYVTLAQLWGSKPFGNIAESESTHQSLVLPLLEGRGIADPRSSEVGVFADQGLQELYDELIARGSTTRSEAIRVGILIEETDIADLSAAIAAEDEADVVSVFERLLAGSENHLAAFQRQA